MKEIIKFIANLILSWGVNYIFVWCIATCFDVDFTILQATGIYVAILFASYNYNMFFKK